jgi:hypothetical protein
VFEIPNAPDDLCDLVAPVDQRHDHVVMACATAEPCPEKCSWLALSASKIDW